MSQSSYSQQQVNDTATEAAAKTPDFDGKHVSCGMLEAVFRGATYGGHANLVEGYLLNKNIEIAAVLHLMAGKNDADVDNEIAHLLTSLISTPVFNVDLDRIAKNIKPCGEKDCQCHNTKAIVVQCLTLVKSHLVEKIGNGEGMMMAANA